jgi:TolA-binding protein
MQAVNQGQLPSLVQMLLASQPDCTNGYMHAIVQLQMDMQEKMRRGQADMARQLQLQQQQQELVRVHLARQSALRNAIITPTAAAPATTTATPSVAVAPAAAPSVAVAPAAAPTTGAPQPSGAKRPGPAADQVLWNEAKGKRQWEKPFASRQLNISDPNAVLTLLCCLGTQPGWRPAHQEAGD